MLEGQSCRRVKRNVGLSLSSGIVAIDDNRERLVGRVGGECVAGGHHVRCNLCRAECAQTRGKRAESQRASPALPPFGFATGNEIATDYSTNLNMAQLRPHTAANSPFYANKSMALPTLDGPHRPGTIKPSSFHLEVLVSTVQPGQAFCQGQTR